MYIRASGGNQQDLRDEQQDPSRERRAMYVNNAAGQRRTEHACEVVGGRKADEHGGRHERPMPMKK